LSVDSRMPLPHGFNLSDLQSQMVQLDWREGRFHWKDAELATLPLELDAPPPPKPFTDLVRAVGERILEVDRVEVPFDFVVPEQDNWWKGDSARELDVPLGRAGAMKLQHLNLGRGTSQHVLVAGKTGSGKSNLLHAIITNVALWYGPDQVELYLVDFKKGVEFKPYAEHNLPHARVIAVESEREFGLSVLERLDAVLKDRGDRFRQAGVQDMAGWRRVRPGETMPRVVLVIDEFQELFVEDDRIAQNAALLLDRLVRQGRAFGMHVLLGSQTLAGAYSLPRATIGQMAVRIALQCSESDAHLILSEDNTAARLLTRPGEAIYNDANGLFEGNHPFQVVWLPDHDRSHYLARLAEWADGREWHGEPPIVFEGNAAADPRHNRILERVLTAAECPSPGQPVRAWLGAAVAIKEPTSVAFRRQGGSNLLLVGHDDESALGILTNAIVSLAAQTPLEAEAKVEADGGSGGGEGGVGVLPATFHILDGTRPEAPEAGFWRRFAKTLPHRVEVSEPRETAAAIGAVAAELSRRQSQGIDDARPIYLVIHDLGRFRDLRREEDTFRFSSRDDDEAP
ncbi:MAG: cell division protein FtsK, partial [Pirellulaceae bacterium]|nr:cell division protein FtsK [Pirellulaceae bacterium]